MNRDYELEDTYSCATTEDEVLRFLRRIVSRKLAELECKYLRDHKCFDDVVKDFRSTDEKDRLEWFVSIHIRHRHKIFEEIRFNFIRDYLSVHAQNRAEF